MFNNFYFFKSCLLRESVEDCCTYGQATDDSMTHEYCMLNTYSYKHTLRICNTLLLYDNNGCMNAPQCYVPRTFPALFIIFFPIILTLCCIRRTYIKIHSKIMHILYSLFSPCNELHTARTETKIAHTTQKV
jgi:hypothetical protein